MTMNQAERITLQDALKALARSEAKLKAAHATNRLLRKAAAVIPPAKPKASKPAARAAKPRALVAPKAGTRHERYTARHEGWVEFKTGIECNCQPYVDIIPATRWEAKGFDVMADVEPIIAPNGQTELFCRCQVIALGA